MGYGSLSSIAHGASLTALQTCKSTRKIHGTKMLELTMRHTLLILQRYKHSNNRLQPLCDSVMICMHVRGICAICDCMPVSLGHRSAAFVLYFGEHSGLHVPRPCTAACSLCTNRGLGNFVNYEHQTNGLQRASFYAQPLSPEGCFLARRRA